MISAMTVVVSTQALLTAVGVNNNKAAGWAAATNWILKDGFGSLGKLFTARMGDQYDANPKMWRLMSDIIFDIGMSLELITPLYPKYFLLLAAVGNFLKSVSITIGMSCRNSVLTTFAKQSNLGEITAKNDGQNVVTNMIGLALGIGTARVLPPVPQVRLPAFLILTAIYSVFNYLSMRSVALATLNRQRAAFILDRFVRGLPIPEPGVANKYEKIIPFRRQRFADPKLRLGASFKVASENIETLVKHNKKEHFIITKNKDAISIILHKNYTTEDLLEALLCYCHYRRTLQNQLGDGCCKKADTFTEKKMNCVPTIKRINQEIDERMQEELLIKSRRYARKNIKKILKGLGDAGYNTRTLLLAPQKVRAEW